jgi:hypothetical protein
MLFYFTIRNISFHKKLSCCSINHGFSTRAPRTNPFGAARRQIEPHHPQPGYKRNAHNDKSIIIHMIIRAPSRVSPQTFINFVYLYVNKQFTTQTLLKVTPNVGHNVKMHYSPYFTFHQQC